MPGPLDRLQRAVAGWVGPVVYALPILEVWLLTRLDDDGATVVLVTLQVGWGLALAVALTVMLRRVRVPPPSGGEPEDARGAATAARRPAPRRRGDH